MTRPFLPIAENTFASPWSTFTFQDNNHEHYGNGQSFGLTEPNIDLTIFGLSNNVTFMVTQHDSLHLIDTGPQTVNMPGQGGFENLTVADLRGPVTVHGFNATDSFTNLFESTGALRASMHSDGHGGTVIGAVHFNTHVDPSQVHGF